MTLSNHSGVAVPAGPNAAARDLAARIITSVLPHIREPVPDAVPNASRRTADSQLELATSHALR